MTQAQHFYSSLPYTIAIDRLKHAQVDHVKVSVKGQNKQVAHFRMDLQQKTPFGFVWVVAHIHGTIEQRPDNQLQVSYRTHALSRWVTRLLPMIGIALTILLVIILPPEFAPIAGAPGIASVLFIMFWFPFGNEFHKSDQLRLDDLLGRMLEKRSTMMTWQA